MNNLGSEKEEKCTKQGRSREAQGKQMKNEITEDEL